MTHSLHREQSNMDTTLSTLPVEEMDVMRSFFPTLEDPDQLNTNDNTSLIFDDEESAALFGALCNETRPESGLDAELQASDIAEEPTTVAPLATLIAADYSPDSVTSNSAANPSTSEVNGSGPNQLTPPTPISKTPSPVPARIPTSVPANVDKQVQVPESGGLKTPEMARIFARHLQEEWISLNHFSNTALLPPTQPLMNYHPAEYSLPSPMFQPLHPHGQTPMPCPVEYGQVCPHCMFCPPMGHPMPPTYPILPPAPRPRSPVSSNRMFEFLEPEMPDNFIANPNNHGRWQYDRSGNRYYLNAPKMKAPRTK